MDGAAPLPPEADRVLDLRPDTGDARLSAPGLRDYLYHISAAARLRSRFLRCWVKVGLKVDALEQACFVLTLPSVPTGVWEAAGTQFGHLMPAQAEAMARDVTTVAASCWRIRAALYLQAACRWRIAYFDEVNNTNTSHNLAGLDARLRSGYATVHQHLKNASEVTIYDQAPQVMRRVLATPCERTIPQESRAITSACSFSTAGPEAILARGLWYSGSQGGTRHWGLHYLLGQFNVIRGSYHHEQHC
ncbi:hypothetical protein PI125_g15901 [Phytophthora idaei]|nr:hypothetical protein PI125_g15901 [Phytophthora idaei]KAG3135021.1 hypothetical protein PI126_g18435 [Phytophthora idaei]